MDWRVLTGAGEDWRVSSGLDSRKGFTLLFCELFLSSLSADLVIMQNMIPPGITPLTLSMCPKVHYVGDRCGIEYVQDGRLVVC